MATHSVEDLGTMLTSRLLQADRAFCDNEREKKRAARAAQTQPFATWAASGGFIADREPVDFSVWRYLLPIYQAVPMDPAGLDMVIMKSTQGGASTFGLLWTLWMCLRAKLCQMGYYLPTQDKALDFSTTRFLKLVRGNPAIHRLMGDPDSPHTRKVVDEGSAHLRYIGDSIARFTYTQGLVTTESTPLDGEVFDEVQVMLPADIEKTKERMSASLINAVLAVSTANNPGGDIDFFFERSDQRWFHTRCECFTGETELVVRHKATGAVLPRSFRDLETTWCDYDALSFNRTYRWLEWQPITAFHDNGVRRIVEARLRNGQRVRATPDHVLFAYPGAKKKHKRVIDRRLADLDLTAPHGLHRADVLVACQLPDGRIDAPCDCLTLYVLGAFVAEGSWQNRTTIAIAQATENGLVRRVRRWARAQGLSVHWNGGSASIGLHRRPDLMALFRQCGHLATGKRFPMVALGGRRAQLAVLLQGYLDGDGHINHRRRDARGVRISRRNGATTVSADLAAQLAFIGLRIGRPWHLGQSRRTRTGKRLYCLLENPRSAFARPVWSRLADHARRREIGRISKVSVAKVVPAGRARVYDITVSENHSYVLAASGLLAHNCSDGIILAKEWDPDQGPLCIDHGNGTTPSIPREPFYVCQKCKKIIRDPQDGTYVAHKEGEDRVGFQFPQMLSPRQTAASIFKKWTSRVSTRNFFNRILGRPYADKTSMPVTQVHLEALQNPDLRWGASHLPDDVEAVVLGADQMGELLYIECKARVRGSAMPRLVWLEIVQGDGGWQRLGQVMREFKVKVAVIEQLPNIDNARRFMRDFPGRAFLADSYGEIADELMLWGDRPRDKIPVRRTDDEGRLKHTVRVDQFKMMAWSLGRIANRELETPDARTLLQELRTDTGMRQVMVCRDIWWLHQQRVALVTEPVEGKENEHKLKRSVQKVGIDPHFAFANMLCDVAWVRVFGTARLLVDDAELERGTTMAQGAPRASGEMEQLKRGLGSRLGRPDLTETCGTCVNFDASSGRGRCTYLNVFVQAETYRCQAYQPIPEEESYP